MTSYDRDLSAILIQVMTIMAYKLFTQLGDRPEKTESATAAPTGAAENPRVIEMPVEKLEPVVRDKPPQPHARTGNPAKIAGYLCKSDILDKVIGDFVLYADQTE